MKKEIWVITIRVNMGWVFSDAIHPIAPGSVAIINIPKGIIPPDYEHLQIEIERKEGY